MKVNQLLSRLSGLLVISLLSACATNTAPVVIRESGGVKKSEPRVSNVPSKPKVQPVAPVQASPSTESPLKKKLLAESERRLSNNEPKAAIVLAERGLRVDRKEPKFYEVLASAYHRLANQSQSSYFAKQGLRYAKKGSDIYRSLSQWL